MKFRLLALFLLLSLGLPGIRVNGQTTLTDLVRYSLEHSRDVKKAALQCEEADYLHKEIRGKGLPQISASGTYSRMFYNMDVPAWDDVSALIPADYQDMVKGMLEGMDEVSGVDMISAGVTATQLIYSQSYWVGLKTTQKTEELYSILKTKTDEDVIADVATGYYQAGSLMLQLQTIEKSMNNLKEIYRIAQLSYQNDFIKESDVNRLKVAITNLEVTRETLKNGVNIQTNYLKAIAGMPADTTLSIDTITLVKDFINHEHAEGFSIDNVPSYQALIKQQEIYNQQVKLSKATFVPTLAAFGKYSYSYYNMDPLYKGHSNYPAIGLSLSFPIFTSGTNYYKVKEDQLKAAQLKEDILKTNDLLTVNYNSARSEYETAGKMIASQTENRELALKVYNQTSMRYQEGMASMSDLLNVNSDYLQADNSLNQQILKYLTAEIKMLKASGNLNSLIK
jgi:outer membrane protein